MIQRYTPSATYSSPFSAGRPTLRPDEDGSVVLYDEAKEHFALDLETVNLLLEHFQHKRDSLPDFTSELYHYYNMFCERLRQYKRRLA